MNQGVSTSNDKKRKTEDRQDVSLLDDSLSNPLKVRKTSDKFDSNVSDTIDESFSSSEVTLESDFEDILKSDPNEALDFALEYGSQQWSELARNSGADINRVDGFGKTRLHNAIKNENVVRILCELGADLNIRDKSGRTALHVAVIEAKFCIAKILLENGATININESEVAKSLGKDITPEVMCLFAAQTKKNKNYPFNVTILEESEIEEYLYNLKKMPLPIDEKINIRSHEGCWPHWWSAQIKIQDNEIKLLTIDSTWRLGCRWTGHPADLSCRVQGVFRDFGFKHSVYADPTARQRNGYSCSMFALTDIKDLCKMNIYFPEYEGNIFNYLEKRTEEKFEHYYNYNMYINLTHLPLRMMRATQYSALIDRIISLYPAEEQALLVNKKRQTMLESSLADIKREKLNKPKMDWETGKREAFGFYNGRMDRKFQKTINQTLVYIKETPLDEIEKQIEEFSIKKFRRNISS